MPRPVGAIDVETSTDRVASHPNRFPNQGCALENAADCTHALQNPNVEEVNRMKVEITACIVAMLEEGKTSHDKIKEAVSTIHDQNRLIEANNAQLVAKLGTFLKDDKSALQQAAPKVLPVKETKFQSHEPEPRHSPPKAVAFEFEHVDTCSKPLGKPISQAPSDEVNEMIDRGNSQWGVRSATDLVRDFALTRGWIAEVPENMPETRIQRIVNSASFDSFSALLIVLNLIVLAVSTDFAARHRRDESTLTLEHHFNIIDYIFTVWFSVELFMRMLADGPLVFFTCISRSWTWNLFDSFVVILGLVEIIVQLFGGGSGSNVTALRVLRVVRVTRALRTIRLFRFFKDLRMMILSLITSGMTLLWSTVLLMMDIFVFSLLLTHSVMANLKGLEDAGKQKDIDALEQFFGSMPSAIYTLFLSALGGISWIEVSDPLFEIGWVYCLFFCFYIFFTMCAILNIITGIFLESAVQACKSSETECIAEQMQSEASWVKAAQKLFAELNDGRSGEITYDAFSQHLRDVRFKAIFAMIGIEVGEAEGLFNLLDLDNSGSLTVEEFLYGCMRMKGGAKEVDMQTLLYENKKLFTKFSRFSRGIEDNHTLLLRVEERLAKLTGESCVPLSDECDVTLTVI